MTEIPNHRHCQMCGKAIPGDQTFCSKECRERFETIIKKRKRLMLILYLILVIVFVMIIYASYAS